MKFERVNEVLRAQAPSSVLHEHAPHLTMDDVAASEIFDNETILKSMAFHTAEHDVVVTVRGEDKLDFGKVARHLGVSRRKLHLMDAAEVQERLGDIPGGIGPIQENNVKVIIDSRVVDLKTCSIGGGRPDRTFELDAKELVAASRAEIVDVVRV